jgi:transposase-like protein
MRDVRRCFSIDLKRNIVAEIEAGHISIREASQSCQAAVSQVKQWLDEFGKYKPKRDVVEVVMKSEKDKISELEKAVAELHMKARYFEILVDLAEKEYGIEIKKNCELQRLITTASVSQEALSPSAVPLELVAPATIRAKSGLKTKKAGRKK